MELLRRQRDAVGISFFSDQVDYVSDIKSSQRHHRELYDRMEERLKIYDPSKMKNTSTAKALHEIAELTPKRSLVILFTDLLDDPDKVDEIVEALQHLKHNKHEVVLFQVMDAQKELDLELENRPHELIDMETGDRLRLNPLEIREEYKERLKEHFNEIRMRCINLNIDFIEADVAHGVAPILQHYLIQRQKMG
tara:strand:- start:484 stop:1065 length:582 start_codon:yes stop_codon:yes gene_type:complete